MQNTVCDVCMKTDMKTLEECAYSLKQVVDHVPEEVCACVDKARMKTMQLKVVRM